MVVLFTFVLASYLMCQMNKGHISITNAEAQTEALRGQSTFDSSCKQLLVKTIIDLHLSLCL